jgi:hypothetical protein
MMRFYVTDAPVASPKLTGVIAMRLNKRVYSALVILLVSAGVFPAQASTVVYEAFEFVTTNSTETKEFMNVAPGLYQATLVDYESPDPFHVLSVGLTQGSTTFGFMDGTDSFTFDVLKPGTLEAHIVTWPNDPDVSGDSKTGLYSLKIVGLNLLPVPVPPAVWLFLSGVTGIIGVARRGFRSGVV